MRRRWLQQPGDRLVQSMPFSLPRMDTSGAHNAHWVSFVDGGRARVSNYRLHLGLGGIKTALSRSCLFSDLFHTLVLQAFRMFARPVLSIRFLRAVRARGHSVNTWTPHLLRPSTRSASSTGYVPGLSIEEYDEIIDENIDVFIAGSGPIGCGYAREILDNRPNAKIWMADIGAQSSPLVGAHHKNEVKYQKDIDAFVHVIQGALQKVSVPARSSFMPTLNPYSWTPKPGEKLNSAFYNPSQVEELNLPGCAITRTVGGMATHWTCACPEPHAEERENCPIPGELPGLLNDAKEMLDVNDDQFDDSIRHRLVRDTLKKSYPTARGLPLAVRRNTNNSRFVTWSSAHTVLGKHIPTSESNLYALDPNRSNPNFLLKPEHKVVRVVFGDLAIPAKSRTIQGVAVRDLKTHKLLLVKAKKYVIACGAVCTPQILWNSYIIPPKALGRYLTEQSIAFCQIVLSRKLVESIGKDFADNEALKKHKAKFCEGKGDPIPIPHHDPEPQVTIPYSSEKPWHTQIHRDAFSYGDVGPRADPRLIVDLRFFGKQDVSYDNFVTFDSTYTDIYGMPQPTFEVKRSRADVTRDHAMKLEMCEVANKLGAFLPGSYPQFMEPGLALHITGTTRLGKDPNTSVANEFSQVHEIPDLYVGGNNVIPDSTACNPTLTSLAYAIHGARHLYKELDKPKA